MRILVLTHRLPYAPNRGDRIRSFHIIQELSRLADVRVVSLVHDREEAAEVPAMARAGVRVWAARVSRVRNALRACGVLLSDAPLTPVLLGADGAAGAVEAATAGWRPDLVFAYCSGIAPLALAPPLADVPMMIDFVDVDSAKWAALAAASAPPRSWVFAREARCLAALEAALARQAGVALVVNDRERDALLRVCPDAPAEVVPNGVDVESFTASGEPAAGRDVVFSGVFDYAPNVEGAVWLAREVWPRVREALPDARLRLVGARPAGAVRRLAAVDRSVEVTGSVADMRPYLWEAAMAVAPLFTARGVQNKVLEAVAASLPVVVTQAVRDGLPEEVWPACRVAGDAESFARDVIEILTQPPIARRRIAAAARLDGLTWRRRLAPLHSLVERAAGHAPGRARTLWRRDRDRDARRQLHVAVVGEEPDVVRPRCSGRGEL